MKEQYAITKAIRFKLLDEDNSFADEVANLDTEVSDKTVQEFITQGQSLTEPEEELKKIVQELITQGQSLTAKLKEYLFFTGKNEKENLTGKVEIKERWLRNHTKEYFYDYNIKSNRVKAHKIVGIDYLENVLLQRIDNFDVLITKLCELTNRPLENKASKPEFALIIAELNKKQNFLFFKEFIEDSQNKSSDILKKQLIAITKKIAEVLKNLEQTLLPNTTTGLDIAKASFNYYTINKKPVNYDEELKNQQTKLEEEQKDIDDIKMLMEKHWQNRKFSLPEELAKVKPDGKERIQQEIKEAEQNLSKLANLTLDNAYELIKKYKAEAKAEFNEACYSREGIDPQKDREKYPMFLKSMSNKQKEKVYHYANFKNSEETHEKSLIKLFKQTKQIIDKNGELNQELQNKNSASSKNISQLKDEIKKLKQKRGDFFKSSVTKIEGKTYANIYHLNLYINAKFKKIAMARGKVIAAIRGIEREKITSQLLNYWALILEQKQKLSLILIPREQRNAVKKLLENQSSQSSGNTKVYYFNSLTFRALHKLCFSSIDSSFVRAIRIENSKYDYIKGSFDLAKMKTEKEQVEFYQSVLQSRYVKNHLAIHNFQDFGKQVTEKQFNTRDEFKKALEKTCYTAKTVVDDELINTLRKSHEAKVLTITGRDLKKNTATKQHTKLWLNFWEDENRDHHFPIRLNPEIKISYRLPKESRVKKYGSDSTKHNRYLHPQFTLTTTITQNAMGERMDVSFVKMNKLKEQIEIFNQRFNQEHCQEKHNPYYYGIDRGQAELATLVAVAKFSNKKNNYEQPIPEFAEFEVYRLKDKHFDYSDISEGKEKRRYAINNLSYFIDNEELFEKKKTASIDLTCAKLIKGKIVENGDVKTYLKLKELNAKRRIYQLFSAAKIDNESKFEFSEKKSKFFIKISDKETNNNIYFYRQDLHHILCKTEIEKILNDYLRELKYKNREKDILTVEKINNIRDAIAANMVGILAHLYSLFPGLIVLENLKSETVSKHFEESNENISRRLEWKLYNKFRSLGLVPPQLKETILLREKEKVQQFGVVYFVSPEGTSKNCPNCSKTHDNNEQYNHDKFNKHLFDCPFCPFHTENNRMGLEPLNNPDSVASYNIAKFVLYPPDKKSSGQLHKTHNGKNKNSYTHHENDGFKNTPFAALKMEDDERNK